MYGNDLRKPPLWWRPDPRKVRKELVGDALHKTFKPFPVIPDRWGELLDWLD
jgi:hypothetical protein